MTSPTRNHRWYHPTPDRFIIGLLAVQVLLLLSDQFQWFWFNEHKGWTVLIALGVVCVAFVVMLTWGLVCVCLRRRFQFGVRSLLLFVLAMSVPLGWFAWEMQRARRQRQAVEAIVAARGQVFYDWEIVTGEPAAPVWLRHLAGDDFLCDVEDVWLTDCEFADAYRQCLNELSKLKSLNLVLTDFADADFEQLNEVTSLEGLHLDHTEVTDAGLTQLKRLTQVQHLTLSNTQVTDAGLENLKGLTDLKWLCLSGTQITDAGLQHLTGLTELIQLDLRNTHVTDEGVEKLQRSLPNCEIQR